MCSMCMYVPRDGGEQVTQKLRKRAIPNMRECENGSRSQETNDEGGAEKEGEEETQLNGTAAIEAKARTVGRVKQGEARRGKTGRRDSLGHGVNRGRASRGVAVSSCEWMTQPERRSEGGG